MDGGPQFDPRRLTARNQPVIDVNRVLEVRHHHALFQRHPADFVPPYGQAHLQSEFGQDVRAGQKRRLIGPALFSAKLDRLTAGQAQQLDQMVEHHRAAQRRGQRRDEQPVKAPRHDAGDRSRRVAAQAVSDEPLLPEKILRVMLAGPFDSADHFVHRLSGSTACLGGIKILLLDLLSGSTTGSAWNTGV
jgi:hypothetical protein